MFCYAPAPNRRGIKRCFCLMYVCLSHTSGLSREQRGLGRQIGTEVAHVTRDSDTTFKVKGQGHQAALVSCTGRPTWTYSNGDLSIGVHDVYHVTTCRPGRGHIVAAARLHHVRKDLYCVEWGVILYHIPSAYSLLVFVGTCSVFWLF